MVCPFRVLWHNINTVSKTPTRHLSFHIWYFSVLDVVTVLTDSVDPKQYIKKMRARDPELNSSWGTICTLTKLQATDGKYYNTTVATAKGILRLIQSIPSPKAEPFKMWLDKSVVNALTK